MTEEYTVERAMVELREWWPDGSFRIHASYGWGEPPVVVMVLRRQVHSVHRPNVTGDTLADCMAQVA